MTKHKPSHIMIVATLVIVFSITLFISATAQMPTFHRNSYIAMVSVVGGDYLKK